MVNCLVLAICYFRFCKKWSLQNFCSIEKWMIEIVDKIVFSMWHCRVIWYLFVSFKTILCSVHSIWFLSIWIFCWNVICENLTRIVKYESQVVKLHPKFLTDSCNLFQKSIFFKVNFMTTFFQCSFYACKLSKKYKHKILK